MNLEYFKKKFDTLYKQHDTRRVDIAADTGIRESKITKLRKLDDPTQPTVDDLIAISDYYNVTVDELLRPQDKKDGQENKTFDSLGDIMEALFKIAECVKMHFTETQIQVGADSLDIPITEYVTCIYFSDKRMQQLIKEWKTISYATFNMESGHKLKELWKKDTVNSCKQYTKENNYIRNDMEQAEYLANNLVNYYNAFLADQCSIHYPLTDDQIASIKYYAFLPTVSEDERNEIYTALSELNTSLTHAPE